MIRMQAEEYRALGAEVSHLSDVLRRNLTRLRAEAPAVAASAVAMMAEARALGRAHKGESCRAKLKSCEQLLQSVLKQEQNSGVHVAAPIQPDAENWRAQSERHSIAVVNESLRIRPPHLSVTSADAWRSRG